MKRLAVGILLSVVAGLVLDACFNMEVLYYFLIAGVAVPMSLWRRRFLCLAVLGLSAANLQLNRPHDLDLAGQDLIYSGIVYGEDHYANFTKLLLHVDKILLANDTVVYHGLVEYNVFGQDVYLGRRLNIKGRIKPARSAYRPAHINGNIVSSDPNDHVLGIVFNPLRTYLDRLLKDLFTDGDYRIASGLILGGSGRLDKEMKEVFSRAGILHILAISGLHVGFVAAFFGVLFLFLPLDYRVKVAVAMCGLVVYAGVTGFRPSVCRATFMAVLFSMALISQRNVDSMHVVNVTALAFLVYNPMLLFDVGAQLSFGAVYGILYLYPRLEQNLVNRVKRRFLRILLRPMAVSFSAQAFVAPLLIYYFHRHPVFAVFTNLIVLPIASIIIFLLFVCFSIGWIWFAVAKMIAVLVSVLITILVGFSSFVASIPGSAIRVSISPAIMLPLYFLAWRRIKWIAAAVITAAACLFVLAGFADCLTVSNAARGLLVTAPDGARIFITEKNSAAQARFLDRQSVSELDYLVARSAYYPARRGYFPLPGRMQFIDLTYGDVWIRVAGGLHIRFRGREMVYSWADLKDQADQGLITYVMSNGKKEYNIHGSLYDTILGQIAVDLNKTFARLRLLF
ncbi:ComEC/Rec2 family competence protein [candidate division WOR-3 bacterium]|nr:ComEC/Rec2 family competence protein [candidate division WOR-3 bacterium]